MLSTTEVFLTLAIAMLTIVAAIRHIARGSFASIQSKLDELELEFDRKIARYRGEIDAICARIDERDRDHRDLVRMLQGRFNAVRDQHAELRKQIDEQPSPSLLDRYVGHEVVLHLKSGTSLRGVLQEPSVDGVELRNARHLGEQATPLDGPVPVLRSNVDFWQVVKAEDAGL